MNMAVANNEEGRLTGSGGPFGNVIRQLRKNRGLRQVDLAGLVFVDHTIISRVETGAMLPGADLRLRLMRALCVSKFDEEAFQLAYTQNLLTEHEIADMGVLSHEGALQYSEESLRLSQELRENHGDSEMAAIAAQQSARLLRFAVQVSGHAFVVRQARLQLAR